MTAAFGCARVPALSGAIAPGSETAHRGLIGARGNGMLRRRPRCITNGSSPGSEVPLH